MNMLKLYKSGLVLMSLSATLLIFAHCNEPSPSEVSQAFNLSDPEKRIHIIFRLQDVYYLNADFEKHLQLIVGNEFKELDIASLSRLIDSFIEDKMLLMAARNGDIAVSLQEQKQYLAKASNDSLPNEKDIPLDEMEIQSLSLIHI